MSVEIVSNVTFRLIVVQGSGQERYGKISDRGMRIQRFQPPVGTCLTLSIGTKNEGVGLLEHRLVEAMVDRKCTFGLVGLWISFK